MILVTEEEKASESWEDEIGCTDLFSSAITSDPIVWNSIMGLQDRNEDQENPASF